MSNPGFEQAYEDFLASQRKAAKDMRSEMLNRDLTGTKKLCEILWEVFGSFDHFVLEYEWVSAAGFRIYSDVYHRVSRIVFEALGFVAHAEKITRDDFSKEQMRIRTYTTLNLKHMPFSWDELNKKPDQCRRAVYECLGRFGNPERNGWMALTVYEREVIRCAMVHFGAFGMAEACAWLQLGPTPTRLVLNKLLTKGLLILEGGSAKRAFRFRLAEEAVRMF